MNKNIKEPEWLFIEELQKPLHRNKPAYWRQRPAESGEVSLAGGLNPDWQFSDPDNVLLTARQDFARFLSILEIDSAGLEPAAPPAFRLLVRRTATSCFEAYRLIICPELVVLEAADSEGIRRGLVALEEEIQKAGAPVLPLGTIERQPFIRTRLSRCFFGPIKRPPMNRDELEDDVNYYPDEYLNRLAHEGVNALWLTITFKDTVPSAILPGYGRRADVHIPKLRRTVAQCARYGIKVYAFFIEPTAMIDEREHPRYADVRLYERDYPQLLGHRQGSLTGFCPSSELARSFLREAAQTLFTLVPGLGGMIDISVGERFTHCWSIGGNAVNCPRCATRKPREVLADVLACFQAGMRAASPDAEFISWPYSQYIVWGDEKTAEAAGHVPDGVMLQHNFESAGAPEQLGKIRRADDYWLSYIGPSDIYRRCAERAAAAGTRMFAKLQVGCSHEVASATHVPVPGILYAKYSQMRRLGVSGAMQSWYFGNYPSLMTRAAGRLSFESFQKDQADFLSSFARIDWGPHAGTVVQAWDYFQQAYVNYPVNHVFGYYAPMHDGPVWLLYLKPVNKPLIANWKFMPEFPEHGDRIGECIQSSHSFSEILLLCSRMQQIWQQGVQLLEDLEPAFAGDPDRLREINNARALGILFASGYDILNFYRLRESLADCTGDEALTYLARMKAIVGRESERSARLSACCERDPALGFNSEHEGFRFYPAKLQARREQLFNLLNTDFPEIEERVRAGLLPFPGYTGQEPDRAAYICGPVPAGGGAGCSAGDGPVLFGVDWQAVGPAALLTPSDETGPCSTADDAAFFKACHDDNWIYLAIFAADGNPPAQIQLFPRRLWPDRTYVHDPDTGTTCLQKKDPDKQPRIEKILETRTAVIGCRSVTAIRISFDELQRSEHCRYNPLQINIKQLGKTPRAWVWRPAIAARLAQSPVNPDDYGWFQFA